jgi:hypothetical protein
MTSQYQVILRAINDDQEKFDLELTNVPEFLLDISAIESGDIGKIFGISSQEFALPGTDINNQFFNNLFDLGVTGAVGLIYTVPCQVLVDGQAVYTGKLYLNSIVTDQYNDVIYNCAVVNETIDFRTRVDNRALADLDWSAYNHNYTWTNISKSFNDDLLDGDIFYPLISYGKDPNNISGSILEFGGGNYQVDKINTPLLITDFKPAIKAKAVVDTIFSSSGFTYESNFFTSSFFDQLYLLTTSNDFKGAFANTLVTQSAYAYVSPSQSIAPSPSAIFTDVTFNNEIFDNSLSFNTTTYSYTAATTGVYTVGVNLPFTLSNFGGYSPTRRAFIRMTKNGSQLTVPFQLDLPYQTNGVIGLNPFQLTLNATDVIKVQILFQSPFGSERFRITAGTQSSFKILGPPTIVNTIVNMADQFPDDLKVLDFFNSLVSKFNLVVEPVQNKRNVLKIEPFNEWVDAGETKDWSDKVDRNVKWEISHPLSESPKKLVFTDKIDQDIINQYQNKTYKNIFGGRTYTSDSDLTDGEKKIETTFAATPVKVIPGSTTVAVPWLYKQEEGKYGQPFQFAPRLLFKQELQTVTATEALGFSGSLQGYFYVNDGNSTFPINYYRTLGPNTTKVVDFNTGFDIHFDNISYYPYQQNYIQGRTRNDAYTNYWSFYINELYDVDTRLVKMNIVLNPDEIQTLQLNDKIFIDGHYYRINYIQGANLIERSSVPVELLKTLPRKLKYPRRRIYTQPNIYVDVVQNDLNENGETGYTNYQTGLPVTSSNIINQASTRDGNAVFENSVVWDTTKTITYNPKISLVGTANYDESSNNVLVLGDAVEVPQATKNVGLFNPTHYDTSSVYKPNTVYVGANVVTSRMATEPKVIDLGQFQDYYITGSDNQYPFYYFNWVGTGSGINYVYLPDAEELNGVAYQMQVSESYTSGREIVLVPSGSQTIEKKLYPSGSVILTVTESMYEFKAVNGEWLSTIKPQSGSINPPSRGSYISIYSTSSDAINIANSVFTASFTTVDFSNDISLISGSQLTPTYPGVYDIQFSAQLDKTNSSNTTVYIWISRNGIEIPDSNTSIALFGGSNEAAVASWNWFVTASVGDYFSINYGATGTNAIIPYVTGTLGPNIPSWIVTMNAVN